MSPVPLTLKLLEVRFLTVVAQEIMLCLIATALRGKFILPKDPKFAPTVMVRLS